ncbi:P-loop containing nucleoside triphosphate hydrolase protein [Amanita rubescens]|nr:P-loop containing nucleoside triphosphate hydrolase protein [Amanita rubescens]
MVPRIPNLTRSRDTRTSSAPKHLESAAPVNSILLPLRITRKQDYGSSPLPSVVIPVMGPTGSGKTTFINNASNAKLPVGRGPEPCTNDMQPVTFEFDRHIVTLIDTPGFDGIPRNDEEILQLVATYLSTMHRYGARLGGVIYLRRVPDPRSDASQARFRKWCNVHSWKNNIVIATNMWQPEAGLAQKQELASDDKTFKPALDNGPMLFRIYNTTDSAHQLLRQLIKDRSDILRPFLVTIAVLGNPGSGKTTFINRACNTGLPVGQEPEARTTDIQHAIFHLDGRVIVLLETPGIDDVQSGAEIPQRISTWLGKV